MDFAEGAIVRIKLENFMTYTFVEFSPGPNLNVIAAPNGCGKSTLVNGICLGLAGKTKHLGRATQCTEFIKHGCDQARTEIELRNVKGDNYVIKRRIQRNGANDWWVNDRPANQKSVEETVARMNIQFGNLCQFLPQDKVADFAKMNSIELLENTEKAVGAQDLVESHELLKNSRGRAREIEVKHKNLKEKLETEKGKNARLEQDVKNYEERQRHLQYVELLGKKRTWLVYEEKRQVYNERRAQKKDIQQRLNVKKRDNKPLEDKLKQSQTDIKESEKRMQGVTDKLRKDAEQAANRNKKIDNLTEKMSEVRDELESKREEEQKRQKKKCELEKQVRALQRELETMEDTNVKPEIDEVNRQKQKLTQQRGSLNQQIDDMKMDYTRLQNEHRNANRELQNINDIANRKLELLRQRHKPTFDAVQWLRENKHRFKGTIHEPIMTQVKIKNERFAKYVENSISFNDMRLFVCEESEDLHLFLKLVRDQQNLPINAACEPADKRIDLRPAEPIRNLAKYGFHTYVNDLFEAPDSIMMYLCKQHKLHNIPVGDRRTKDCVDAIAREKPGIRRFFSENDTHNINKSRYSGNVSTTRAELRQSNLLSSGGDTSELENVTKSIREFEQKMTTIRENNQDLAKQVQQLDVQLNLCNTKKLELTRKRDQRSSFTQQINVKQETIKRLDREATDVEKEENKAMKKIQDINLDKCKLLEEMKNLTKNCASHSMNKVRLNLRYTMALHHTTAIESEFQEQLNEINLLEADLRNLSESCERAKEEASQLLARAREATGSKGEDMTPEIRDSFSTIPNSVDEIDALIHATQARADLTFETGENVIREFQQRKKEIAKLEKEYEANKRHLDNYESEIEELKKGWLEPLRGLIQKINKNFSHFFRVLKCAGEVDLEVPEDEDDYEKYGIQVKVKFRDGEPLSVLSAHAQSGGEKSVSTVLYMMSLQELTKCPFRVVDEINQGMDAYNERRVYEMILSTSCDRVTSQYFLLTPKLLPDLPYSPSMRIISILNGPSLIGQKNWHVRKFLKRRSQLAD